MNYNLSHSGNYPCMTQQQWEDAPFNQVEPEEEEFDCEVTETLVKETSVISTDYYYNNDTGNCVFQGDYTEDFKDGSYDAITLIGELKTRVEKELKTVKTLHEKRKLERLLKACTGWKQEELIVEEA